MRLKSNIYYVAFAVILVGVIGTQVFVLTKKDTASPKDALGELWSGNYGKERAFWAARIDKVGAERAYTEFKDDTMGKGFGVSHTLAHIFGELLYESEGIKGVSVCDSTFAFGCYHSFFGKAISDKGIAVVDELDRACIAKWGEKGLGCPHGIGHGIQGYYGDDRLIDSLRLCSTLNWKEPIGGCTSGVFMEYNFHTMESTTGAENRVLDPQHPHDPCDAIPKEYGQACYFEQPQWWSKIFYDDYSKVGSLCSGVADRYMLEACYRGLGNTIGPATFYDAPATSAFCDTVGNKGATILCKQGASWAFYAEPSARNRAGDVCEGVPAAEKQHCIVGFDIAGDRI